MTRSLHDQVRCAEYVAASALRRPSLVSVVVQFNAGGQIVETLCEFRCARRPWFRRALLDACQVRVAEADGRARMASRGTFQEALHRRMAGIGESQLRRPELDITDVLLNPADGRALVRRLVALEAGESPGEPQTLAVFPDAYRILETYFAQFKPDHRPLRHKDSALQYMDAENLTARCDFLRARLPHIVAQAEADAT